MGEQKHPLTQTQTIRRKSRSAALHIISTGGAGRFTVTAHHHRRLDKHMAAISQCKRHTHHWRRVTEVFSYTGIKMSLSKEKVLFCHFYLFDRSSVESSLYSEGE